MNPLIEIEKLGQSIWYDNIRRALIDSGDLAQKIGALPSGVTSTLGQKVEGDGLRGVTSNPTIFEKAITGSTDYDEAMRRLVAEGKSADEIYEAWSSKTSNAPPTSSNPFTRAPTSSTVTSAWKSLRCWLATPKARSPRPNGLWAKLDRPNVMIKIPATPEGLPAIASASPPGSTSTSR